MVFCTDFRFIKALFLTLLLCHSNSEATEGTQMGTGKLAGMMSGAVALGLFAKPAFNYVQQRNFYEIGSKFSYVYVGFYTMIRGVSPEAKRAADEVRQNQQAVDQARIQGDEKVRALQNRIDELTGELSSAKEEISTLRARLDGNSALADAQAQLRVLEIRADLERGRDLLKMQLDQKTKELDQANALNNGLAQENGQLRNIVDQQRVHLTQGALLFERMRQHISQDKMAEGGDDSLHNQLTSWTKSEVMNLSAASVSARVLYPQRPQIGSLGFPVFGIVTKR